MSYFLGGLGVMGGGTAGQYRTDESWYVRAGRRDMSHTKREDSGWGSRFGWATLWPHSAMMSGDISAGAMIGDDPATGCDFFMSWGPWQRSLRGNGRLARFAAGYTYNSSGGILGGATVQVFRTSDDLYVSETQSDDTGRFEAFTPYPGVAHYFVAYAAGSPDVTGATVNTLTAS